MTGSAAGGTDHAPLVLALGTVFAIALVAGCLGEDPDVYPDSAGNSSPEAPPEGPYVDLADRAAGPARAVSWDGGELDASAGGGSGCDGAACERVPFEVGPAGGNGSGADELVVTATWDPYQLGEETDSPEGDIEVRVLDPEGDVLARGSSVYFSAVALLEDPEPGSYEAQVRATEGATSYVGSVHLQDRPDDEGPVEDLLPDLVTTPVIQLTRDRALAPNQGTVDGATGTRGCSAYEMTERGARNCLRFTTSIGNVGQGPLELRLGFENATLAMTPAESRFAQTIHRSDGSTRDVAGAQAEYHPTHEHYHYHGVAGFTLYAWDPAEEARGEVVREGRKSGWCVVDMGLVDPAAGPPTTEALYPLSGSRNPNGGGSNCQAATPTRDMVTGISPGWYDMYEWFADDQYVEVSGLADGTYELVVEADPEGHILESDPSNNAAGVVFAWEDGEPRVLDRWSEGVGGDPGTGS